MGSLKAKIYHKQSKGKRPFSGSNPGPYTVFLIVIGHWVKGKNTVFQNHKTVKRKWELYRFLFLCIQMGKAVNGMYLHFKQFICYNKASLNITPFTF